MTAAAPKWVQVVTVAAVSLVAAVAAVVSYVHMRHLALQAGEGWRAMLIPLSVDGLLIAASMVMLVRRRAGEHAGLLPWVGLLLGLAASLAANIAAGQPAWRPWWLPAVVAAWPPIALAVSFELLILVNRGHRPGGGETSTLAPAAPGLGDSPPGLVNGDLLARARELVADGAGRPTVARELAVSDHEARRLVRLAKASTNGAGR